LTVYFIGGGGVLQRKQRLLLRLYVNMALTDNDTRGWVMSAVSGIGMFCHCVFIGRSNRV
jgi:hypothetical protein